MKSYDQWKCLSGAVCSALILGCGGLHAASITANVAWGQLTDSTAGAYAYGLNLFQGSDPAHAPNATYRANVAAMKAGLVRYHRSDLMEDSATSPAGWVISPNTSAYRWDAARINTVLSQSFANNPVKMVNIPGWPAYMSDANGKLKTSMYGAYATFCADLVTLVNITQGRGVKYWEVTNEKDGTYGNDMTSLATIYNQCRDAMIARDGSIKIGGPSFARPDITSAVETFIANAHAKLDFISYHSYPSGNSGDANSSIWNAAAGFGGTTWSIKRLIAKYTTRAIETHHNEFNISYNPPDGRMNNIKGAIFDALAMNSIAMAGANASCAWNEADGWYGKLEGWSPWNRRPSSYLYELYNQDMKGRIVHARSSDSSKVAVMAAKEGNWKKVVLINRSEASQTVQMSFSSWSTTPSSVYTRTVSGSGPISYTTTSYSTLTSSAGYTLPADTIVVFVYQDSGNINTAPIPDGTYRIIARHSGKALDVSGASTADGAIVHQWSYGGWNNQRWTLTHLGSGQYKVVAVHSGKALDVNGASTADGAQLIQWPYGGGNNQKWKITPIGDGYYRITAVHSGKDINVGGNSTADGASVVQYPFEGGWNSYWSILAP